MSPETQIAIVEIPLIPTADPLTVTQEALYQAPTLTFDALYLGTMFRTTKGSLETGRRSPRRLEVPLVAGQKKLVETIQELLTDHIPSQGGEFTREYPDGKYLYSLDLALGGGPEEARYEFVCYLNGETSKVAFQYPSANMDNTSVRDWFSKLRMNLGDLVHQSSS